MQIRKATLADEIETQLAVLIGLPLWHSNRAADLQGFQFGAKRSRVNRRGETIEVGEYALHVQCAFRLLAGPEILVASRDRYAIVDGGETWDRQGTNLLDARMAKLIAERCPAQVAAVRATPTGDLTLAFAGGLTLEIWIDDSGPDEHWRLLRPGDDASHVVFEGGHLVPG